MAAIVCEICGRGPVEGPPIFRVNPPGEMPARWRCNEHLTTEQKKDVDTVVKDIVQIIEKDHHET